jgi:hypothetical protein
MGSGQTQTIPGPCSGKNRIVPNSEQNADNENAYTVSHEVMLFNPILRLSAVLLMSSCAFAAADTINVSQPRAMLALTGELADRYGYLVTYEDAPADSSREILRDRRADGLEDRHLISKPVAFHVSGRSDLKDGTADLTQRKTDERVKGDGQPSFRRPGPDVMDPLLLEYHASGNPGKFAALYEGEYTHIVPSGRTVNGRIEDFQPILSTIVPVSQQQGLCNDVLNGLLGEIRQIRGVKIVEAAVPMNPLLPRGCSVRGHDLPARQVLIQLLDQLGADPRTGLREDRFMWTLVHDPLTDAYFLSTMLVQPTVTGSPGEPVVKGPEAKSGPAAGGSSKLDPFTGVKKAEPIKK